MRRALFEFAAEIAGGKGIDLNEWNILVGDPTLLNRGDPAWIGFDDGLHCLKLAEHDRRLAVWRLLQRQAACERSPPSDARSTIDSWVSPVAISSESTKARRASNWPPGNLPSRSLSAPPAGPWQTDRLCERLFVLEDSDGFRDFLEAKRIEGIGLEFDNGVHYGGLS